MAEQTNALKSELEKCFGKINDLTDEVTSLRAELTATKESFDQHSALPTPSADAPGPSAPPPSFAEIVKSSVQSVLREEKVRSDVVVSNIPENSHDADDLTTICNEIGSATIPINVERIGKKNDDRPRLIKATFSAPFDARTFQLKVNEAKKAGTPSVSSMRCRPGRTKVEQEAHTKLSKAIYKLNQDAKDEDSVSFSLRHDGQVWKFAKNDQGNWKRVTDWRYTSGN